MISTIIITFTLLSINERGNDEFIASSEKTSDYIIDYFIENQFNQLNRLIKAHTYWTQGNEYLALEDAANLDNVLTLYSASNAGFSDCLILDNAQLKNTILYTFDSKLSKLHGAKYAGK